MKFFFCIPCLAFFALGCQPERAARPGEARREIVLLPDSSFEFACFGVVPGDGNGMLSLFDKVRQTVCFFDDSGKIMGEVALRVPDSLRTSRLAVYPAGRDSILVIRQESRDLWLFDGKGALVRSLSATGKLTDGSSDYVLIGMPQSPVLSDGKTIYAACTRMDVVVRTPEARKTYFTTPPDIAFTGDAQSNTGVWPAEYRSGENFRDYYPQRCINGKGQLVYGFAASDSLFVMENGKIVSQHFCKSRHMTERHAFPDDSTGHFEYLDRYLVNEPRYRYLVYDPYRNLYYRVVHHAIAYEKEGGMMKNDYLDKPWSLMILDENFSVLSETNFDPAQFLPGVYAVKDGILLVQRKTKNNVLPVKLTLYTISE